MKKVYQQLATSFTALLNCERTFETTENEMNRENAGFWLDRHRENIESICRNHLPSGSGIDCGTAFNFEASRENRLVLNTSYHHMDQHGGYDRWTDHQVIITPDLQSGFNLRITGRNRNEIKDYLAEVYHSALSEELKDESKAA